MSATLRTESTARKLAGKKVLTVGIIGAGRVGTALGTALRRAGHTVTVQRRGAIDIHRVELVILAVPDDALAPLVAHLAEERAFQPGQVVAHTSGAHGVGVLHPAVARGVRPLALHPAMTFAGRPDDVDRLAGTSYGVTAPDDVKPLAERLVADLGGVPEWIAEQDRAMYHTALAHGANHLVTLVNEALDRLRDAGTSHPEHVLGPLLRAALENTLRLGDAALTGPVSRGDAGTIARHLDTLAAAAPDSVPSYLALARRTADRAIASGRLRPADAETLLDVLATRR
ncbi:MAG TPA: DUF2520 domain-containing protein [Micromonosporaceae bacterium]|nr:DUF2520 domain-containing protein [Micromonosporaceae bacterium]